MHNPTLQVQTNQWATDAIIARADALAAAKLSMRDKRFEHQFNMRNSATTQALDVAVANWDAFIVGVRASLAV